MIPACVRPTCGQHDDVRGCDLLEQLSDGKRVSGRAERRGGPERDHERTTIPGSQLGGGLLHPGRARGARVDIPYLGAEQAIEQRIRGRLRGGRSVGYEHATQAQACRDRRGRTRVIRLHSATGDERVGPFGQRLCDDQLELPDLVPAKPEWNRIVALDEQRRARRQVRPEA
jgi:hypothetical protein